MGVSRGVASFTVPFGATINMDGNRYHAGRGSHFIAGISEKATLPTDYLMELLRPHWPLLGQPECLAWE